MPMSASPIWRPVLNDTSAQITARARRLTKMLDNNKRSYGDIFAEFAAEWEEHHNASAGNAVWSVRWLETDMTVEDAKRLLSTIQGARLEAFFVLALTTGLHRGELLAWR